MPSKLFKANGSLRNYLNVLGFSFYVPLVSIAVTMGFYVIFIR